jgi:hypothetical protein
MSNDQFAAVLVCLETIADQLTRLVDMAESAKLDQDSYQDSYQDSPQ